jgi:DNA-binding winged helix-turn-helix (wHTH) protein
MVDDNNIQLQGISKILETGFKLNEAVSEEDRSHEKELALRQQQQAEGQTAAQMLQQLQPSQEGT